MEKILTPDVSQAGLWALAPGELADAGLDDLVWLAAHVCTAPVAYLSYRDAGMRRFRHVVGATIADMPAARFLGVGAGTRFHFQLPVVQASHDFPSIVGAPLPDAPRVLVVEDDHDIAQLIVLMLNRAQIAADVAGTALQAIESLQQARYAAMTLDLLLPDQSGLVLMRHIRDLPGLIDLPVVVVSAHTEDGRHSLNRELAPIEWIPKPIDEHRLIRAVRRALEHRTPN